MQKALIAIVLFSGIATGAALLLPPAPLSDNSQPDLRYASAHLVPMRFEPPSELSFAGEAVPMEDENVVNRLQKELNLKINHTAGTHQLYRRVLRYQEQILSILREKGVPEDFFFLAMAESALSNAVSPVGAGGFWQFMPATARSYGLIVNDNLDERFDPVKSTYAATRYLRALHKELGSWTLVAAAYNMGSPRLVKAMKAQQENSYYLLDLNAETSRYLFRILANKCIVEQPARYGFDMKQIHPYPALRFKQVPVQEDISDLASFAAQHGLTLDQLLTANPWIRSNQVSASQTLRIQIPLGKDVYAAEWKVQDWGMEAASASETASASADQD